MNVRHLLGALHFLSSIGCLTFIFCHPLGVLHSFSVIPWMSYILFLLSIWGLTLIFSHPLGVLHSFSVENTFYECRKQLFCFDVTIYRQSRYSRLTAKGLHFFHFKPMFLYSLKTSENQRVFVIFRRSKNGVLT